jgi:Cytochrome c
MRRIVVLVLLLLVAGCRGGGSEQAATTRPSVTSAAPSGQVLVGQNIFFGKQKYFCWVCHSIGEHEGNGRGPDLNRLPELAARAKRGPVEAFIRDSILHPNAYTESGFEKGLMAQVEGIPGEITAEQLDALVAFLTAARS